MPDRYGAPSEAYAAEQLVCYLRRHSTIKVVYPYEELMQAKRDFADIDIYYPTGTHWNYVGSYIGTRELMRQLDIEFPELTREMIQKPEADHTGDLSKLAHLETWLPKSSAGTRSASTWRIISSPVFRGRIPWIPCSISMRS